MVENETHCAFAVDPRTDAGWRWRVFDDNGETRAWGHEPSQRAAVRSATRAIARTRAQPPLSGGEIR